MKLHIYLNFNGQAEEAVLFYAKAFNTEAPKILKFGDMPQNPNFPITEEAKDLVMHTEVLIADTTIKISDSLPNNPAVIGTNSQVAFTFESEEEFDAIFSVLGEEAKIIVPVGASFFAEKYVYFTDKFGILWHLIVQKNH